MLYFKGFILKAFTRASKKVEVVDKKNSPHRKQLKSSMEEHAI